MAFRFRHPITEGKLEIFAAVADVFLQHRFGAAFAALVGRPRVVMRAIQADPQVGPAFHANFAAARLAVQRPRLTTVVTMTGHRDLRFMIYDL